MTVYVTEMGKNKVMGICGEVVELLEKTFKIILTSFKCAGSIMPAK